MLKQFRLQSPPTGAPRCSCSSMQRKHAAPYPWLMWAVWQSQTGARAALTLTPALCNSALWSTSPLFSFCSSSFSFSLQQVVQGYCWVRLTYPQLGQPLLYGCCLSSLNSIWVRLWLWHSNHDRYVAGRHLWGTKASEETIGNALPGLIVLWSALFSQFAKILICQMFFLLYRKTTTALGTKSMLHEVPQAVNH